MSFQKLTVDYGGLVVDYAINFLHFYPLEKYQFENFNSTLVLVAGPETA